MIRFLLFGAPDLRDGHGAELRSVLAQPKRLALLAYLALEASDGFCRRDRLLALFWPEFDTERARLSLRQALHFLRHALGANAIVGRGDEEIGVAGEHLWCDAVAFQQAIDQGRVQDAVDLYRADLLPGFFIADASTDLERWLEDKRTRLRQLAASAAWSLAESAERAGNNIEAALRGRDAVRLAPDDEAGVRRLIALLDRLGDRGGALRTYDSFAQRLQQEFELDPSAETRVLVESVRARSEAVPQPAAPDETATPSTGERAPKAQSSSARTTKKRRNRRWAAVLGAVAVIGIAILILVLMPRKPSDAVPLLAVGWVENQAGVPSAEVARLLPGLLATDLARVRGLAVVSDARIYEMLAQLGGSPESTQAITDAARRAGADELLQGVLYRRSDTLRLDLRRVDLRNGVVRDAITVLGSDAFNLTDRATATIARGFSLGAPQTPLAKTSTHSLAARRLYEEGLRAYYRGQTRMSYDLFAAAVNEDSTFAMAAYYAGTSLSLYDANRANLYFSQSMRMAERAPERDRLLIKLSTHATDQAVYQAVAETLAARFPREPDGHLALAFARNSAGDSRGAMAHARRVLAMDSLSLTGQAPTCRACEAYSALADAYIMMDSLRAAERVAREWVRKQPSSPMPWNLLMTVLRYDGNAKGALDAFHAAEKLQPSASAIETQALIAIHADDFATAERLLRERLQYDPQDANALWYLVITLRNEGRIREALQTAERAFPIWEDRTYWGDRIGARLAYGQTLFEAGRFRDAAAQFDSVAHFFEPTGPLTTRGRSARHLSWTHTHVATALAAAGDTSALQSLADSIAAVAPLSSYGRDWHLPDHVRGLSWLARNQPERAIQSFRAAIYSPTVGFTRTNLELGRTLLALNRPKEAVAALQPALHGPVEASNLYVTRTELHELLARSFRLANQRDSAAAHYRIVVNAWSAGDPPFRARADSARAHLTGLTH